NVLLFLPFGFGLGLRRISFVRALLFVVAVTGTVEGLQAVWIVGRDASLSDLITNTAGGMLGWWFADRWRALVWCTGPHSRRLSVGSLVCLLLVWLVPPIFLAPHPPNPPWYPQLSPQGVPPADFPGRFLASAVNSRELPDGPIAGEDGLIPGHGTDTA